MNDNEIVRELGHRADAANKRGYSGEASEWLELADLIESLKSQLEQKTNEAEGMRSNWYKCIEILKESQRRADAAVADLEYACGSSGEFELRSICDICRRKQTDGTCPTQCEMNSLAASNKWEWRGPIEDGKGE